MVIALSMVISKSSISDFISRILVINSWIFLQFLCRTSCSLPRIFHLEAQFCSVYQVFRWLYRSLAIHSLEALTKRNLFYTVSVHIFSILATALQTLSWNSQIFSFRAYIISIQSSLSTFFDSKGGSTTTIPFTYFQNLASSRAKLISRIHSLWL